MIETPPKVWRPKVKSKYIPTDNLDDIDDGIFDYTAYGRTFFRPKHTSKHVVPPRNDVILFNEDTDREELTAGLRVGSQVTDTLKGRIISIIEEFWDCFCKRGAYRPILGYEFGIDTGASKPVSARQVQYGPHESKIIMKQILDLLKNEWIRECDGPWGSIIVLAPKPHQEHVEKIEDFVWRMCVSYRGLNAVTKPFTYPIPRCDDAIHVLNIGGVQVFLITVDAKQGYHQIAVKKSDQEKLAFFAPNHKKYTYRVMPFGPTNAPAFYTCMMVEFREEWDALFYSTLRSMETLDGTNIEVNELNEVFVDGTKESSGSKGIIDDILIWSTNVDTVLHYFRMVCVIFKKYRFTFDCLCLY